jgi:tryptophan synthase alpha chain
MTNRLQSAFSAARQQGKKLLCPFFTAGYPNLETSSRLMKAAQDAGAGCLELGIPFSDPVADGPVIQASFTHALAAGATVDASLNVARQARTLGVTLPIVAMVSYSIIFKRGVYPFARSCAAAGIDAIILPDVPLEEAPAVVAAMKTEGLLSSLLIAPTTPPPRRAAIAKLCDAFIYYVSVVGITGERNQFPPDLVAQLQSIRTLTPTPLCVGFGISTPEQVRQLAPHADGIIVASAIMRRIGALLATPEKIEPEVHAFICSLATGL